MKEIKVMIKDKFTLELCENASAGDIINLQDINTLDTSIIESIILSGKDEVYNKKLKEYQEKFKLENEQKFKDTIHELEKKHFEEISQIKQMISEKNSEITSIQQEHKILVSEAVQKENQKYQELLNKYTQLESEMELKLANKEFELKSSYEQIVNELKNKIDNFETNKQNELTIALTKKEAENSIEILEIRNKYADQLREKDETISLLNRQKAAFHNKLTGEDLESWCDNTMKEQMQNGFFNCTWEKDNVVVKNDNEANGSKADYIFKVFASPKHLPEELLASVCMDMKDENPDSKNKKTNESHFKTLDKNRTKKNCKYAVLVSNLETDKANDIPIYKVREYPDMYVVRPGYLMTFLHMITSLTTRFSELILKEEENYLAIKDKEAIIEEFNKIKNTYLEKPLNSLETELANIKKSNDAIVKASEAIDSACNKITSNYINGILQKLDKFTIELNRQIKRNKIE